MREIKLFAESGTLELCIIQYISILLRETKCIPGPLIWTLTLFNVLICLKKGNLLSWRKCAGHKELDHSYLGQQVLMANLLTGWIPRRLAYRQETLAVWIDQLIWMSQHFNREETMLRVILSVTASLLPHYSPFRTTAKLNKSWKPSASSSMKQR